MEPPYPIGNVYVEKEDFRLMNRDRLIKIGILLLGFLVFLGTTPWIAIEGKVVEVQGGKAKIQYEGKYAPSINDKVDIGFKIGNDFVPVEGDWRVVDVNEQFFWAGAKGPGAGTPGLDYLATASTRNPQKRADLARPQKQKDKSGNYIPFIPTLKAHVESLRFFESGDNLPAAGARIYNDRFPQKSTRRINWELQLKHPAPGQKTDFKITAKYYFPDGSLFTEHHLETYLDATWTGSQHASGWGWTEPGNWKLGRYTVEIFVKYQKIAHGAFTVY
jgi:hypothetical protein